MYHNNILLLCFFIFISYLCEQVHSKLPSEVFESLIKINGFKNEMDTYGCNVCNQTSETELLIFMNSKPEHVANRHTVRATWGKRGDYKKSEVRIVFLVRVDDADVTEKLIREQYDHEDIVRTRVLHTDKMMSRVMSSLLWIRNHCQKAKFVMKIDEAVMVNIPAVMTFIRANKKADKVVWGSIIEKSIYTTKDLQNVKQLDVSVCEKWAIMMTGDVIQYLLRLNIKRNEYYDSGLNFENEYITSSAPNHTLTKIHEVRFKPDSHDDNNNNFVYLTNTNVVT